MDGAPGRRFVGHGVVLGRARATTWPSAAATSTPGVGQVLAEVGLPARRLDLEMTALSGGQFARAALAAILLSRFDVLLLDEPTNNLDFAGLDQLERFVTRDAERCGAGVPRPGVPRPSPSTASSRSRRRPTGRSSTPAAGRTSSRRGRLARRQALRAFQSIRRPARHASRRGPGPSGPGPSRARPRSGAVARRTRTSATPGSQRSEKQASKARATERAMERLQRVEKPWEGWQLHMELAPTARSGDVVVRLEDAVVRRGSFTLGPVDLEIGWAERDRDHRTERIGQDDADPRAPRQRAAGRGPAVPRSRRDDRRRSTRPAGGWTPPVGCSTASPRSRASRSARRARCSPSSV